MRAFVGVPLAMLAVVGCTSAGTNSQGSVRPQPAVRPAECSMAYTASLQGYAEFVARSADSLAANDSATVDSLGLLGVARSLVSPDRFLRVLDSIRFGTKLNEVPIPAATRVASILVEDLRRCATRVNPNAAAGITAAVLDVTGGIGVVESFLLRPLPSSATVGADTMKARDSVYVVREKHVNDSLTVFFRARKLDSLGSGKVAAVGTPSDQMPAFQPLEFRNWGAVIAGKLGNIRTEVGRSYARGVTAADIEISRALRGYLGNFVDGYLAGTDVRSLIPDIVRGYARSYLCRTVPSHACAPETR
jgi:hypothetical protein